MLLAPVLAVVIVLFLGGVAVGLAQSLGFLPFLAGSHLGLDAYRAMWHDRAVRESIALTLRVAVLSTVASAVLGVAGALLIRSTGRGRRLVSGIFQANLPVPHIVGALAMLLLLQPTGLVSRLAHAVGLTASAASFPSLTNDRFGWSLLAEYVWKETPFIGVVVLASLSSGVIELEDVARTLGAGAWSRLRHVVIPIITPGVLATSVIVFAFSFGSYEVPYLLGRPYPATLPVVAYQYFEAVNLQLGPRPWPSAWSLPWWWGPWSWRTW